MPRNLTLITDKGRNHCLNRCLPVIILLLTVLSASLFTEPAAAQSNSEKKFTVTIDAGHGGHDSGARGKNSYEKNLALGIALKLGHYIESLMDDVNVYYTRKTDVFIPLYERAQIANKNKSDLFISVHVNAIDTKKNKSNPHGTSTYVMGFSRSADNLDLVMQENKAVLLEKDYKTRYVDFDPTSPESYILYNNVKNNNLSESLEIASAVQDQFRTRGQRKDMGVHQGNLVVLWGSTMPSVLIETGFISNPQEEAFLMTEDGQDIIASAIYMAIRGYKESVDQKVSSLSQSESQKAETAAKQPVVENKPVMTEKKAAEPEKKVPDTIKGVPEPEKKSTDTAKKTAEPAKKPVEIEKKTVETEQKVTVKDTTQTVAAVNSGAEFRVQILASLVKLPIDAREFKGQKNLKEFYIDGYYKYMSQPVKNYQEALDLKRQLNATFQGAFIVGFLNGEKVPLSKITDQRKK